MAQFAKHLKTSAAPSKRSSTGSRRWRLIVGGVFLVVVCLGSFGVVKTWRRSAPPVDRASVIPASNPGTAPGIEKQSGPWGELEITDIQIDPPDENAARFYKPPLHNPWFFGEGYDRKRILSLIKAADLTASQRSEFMNPSRWETTAGGIRIRPDPLTVRKLTRIARSQIYGALARFPENFSQSTPFMFPQKQADDWFFHSGLTSDTMALISGYFYQRGTMLCFSDIEVFDQISTDEEKTRLIMTLSRTSTVLVNLRIPSGTDPSPLVRYWCGAGDRSGACQLVTSVARGPNGGSVDITHLLPPSVRELVYTYPQIPADHSIEGPNCFWSALNFEQGNPNPANVSADFLVQRLKEGYESVTEPLQLGDVMVFSNGAGRIVHACVYIAGNIVFTKNGAGLFKPWVLMRTPDVMAIYSDEAPPKMHAFRKKGLKSS